MGMQKISVRISDNMLDAVDELIEFGGDDLRLFPHGAPSRSEMVMMCVARCIEVWQTVVRDSDEHDNYMRDKNDAEW